jgi:LPXTG-site transpeptidase (sortase) family protein
MSRTAARVVLAASIATLAAVVVVWAEGRADAPRVDLVGDATPRRTAPARSAAGEVPTPSLVASTAPVVAVATPPDTTPPASLPGIPMTIAIPSIGVEAEVVAVGLEPDGSMEIPGAAEAGWYHYGVRPGHPQGSAVIAGHVDHARQPGVFIELRRLEVGSEVVVTDADGVARQFVVAERYQVDKQSLPGTELFRREGEPMLTLITCGGAFDRRARSYADNIVVRAIPVATEAA